MPLDKLYVRIICTMCKGTKLFEHGYHDPLNKFKWKSCPYCDVEGKLLIEASDSTIIEFLRSCPQELRQKIMLEIQDKEEF